MNPVTEAIDAMRSAAHTSVLDPQLGTKQADLLHHAGRLGGLIPQWQYRFLDHDLYSWTEWTDCDEDDAVDFARNYQFQTRMVYVPMDSLTAQVGN